MLSMSGHSKWSTIKRQKEATDKQRGTLFTKLGRAISVAVREGGGVTDPEMNFKLRLAVEKAREANMPKANIERAIVSGSSVSGGQGWEEIIYEGYGPAGTAMMVKVVTDNRNRALGEMKQIFDKGGGVLGQTGSVNYLFDQAGWLWLDTEDKDNEELMLQLMEIEGVLDVDTVSSEGKEMVELFTDASKFKQVQDEIKARGIKVEEAELILKPKIERRLGDGDKEKVGKFIERLEESDDVQQVFCDVIL